MFSNQGARKSVDSLSPTLSVGHRGDFPFHGTAPHGSQRPHQRRGSTASSIHSIGGSLDTWGTSSNAVFESGQNAISTLLQPPIVRTGLLPHTAPPTSSSHKPPTARDIPPVALTNIPHVEASEFTPYLSQVGALYEQLRRIQADEDQGTGSAHRRGAKPDEYPEALDEGHLRPGRRPGLSSRRTSTASLSSLPSIEAAPATRRSSSRPRRGQAHGPPPLSTIPTVYFDEDFHLENPRTFDVVSERSEVVRPAPGSDEKGASNGQAAAPRKALATNAILQEKLSWYMDTVEMHLIQSISTASTTFFTALGSLRELHAEAADSVDRIRALRKELGALDEEVATGGLNLVHQRRKRENVKQLHEAVMQLREIVDGVAVCESLVDAGEVNGALDNIDTIEKLMAGEVSGNRQLDIQLRDLRGATALQGVSSDLDTLRLRIGKSYEAKFLNTLLTDLKSHVEQVSSQEVLMRWSSASARTRGTHSREPSAFPAYMAGTNAIRAELLSSLTGLQRAKYLTAAATAYREAALREIRTIIRQQMPSSNDDDNESLMSTSTRTGGKQRSQQDRSIILARNLRALEPQDAEQLLTNMYIGVSEALRRLSTQAKVLLDVASSIGEPPVPSGARSPLQSPPFSPTARQASGAAQEAQEEIHMAVDIANLLGQAVDVAHEKIVKVLRVRSEQSKRLDLLWFLRYFTLNLHFANECEAISGRSGTTLKTVVNSHIKDFIQYHGDAENQKLAQGMESDLWNAADFGDKDTELLGQLLESSTRDAAAWAEGTQIWIPHPDTKRSGEEVDVLSAQTNGASKTKTRSAVVESESFLLPNSAISCMHGMVRFLHLMTAIPSMTGEISASLIAFLQLFNSRCTQLILGAGATRSAGLKNITTKHLALASQALAFIATIIPHVREFVRRHCGSGTAASTVMGEFDKVRRAFQEHQNNIYDKLVEIMSGRALAGTKKLKAVGWDQESGSAANEYMETLAKETTTLHRNLTKHLPEGTVRMIMMPVFRNYKDTFGAAYQGVELKTEQGRERMLRDVEFFQSRLGKIDGFENAGDYLVKAIKSKQIIAPPPPLAPEPAPSPPPAPEPAPSPPPAPETTDEAEDGKKSREEQSPYLEAQVATAVRAEKNGESNDASKA
ncbi:vacuolar protein sorting-associated protein 54 [Parachaetomium inaequale]|uniref:Vacuolar protein sorting-associated protein 54 n=1 Tax=Parachaetomium inaequale TaxID=2588326 RepID=A0AAN6PAU3_9PEZI|nr:vacuolar protein sorting-associated protein 54 [Parachaetomium inaequale]